MLDQCWKCSKQRRNNAATLCCAKNRRCESSRVVITLPRTQACSSGFAMENRERLERPHCAILLDRFAVAFSTKLETPRNEASDYIIMHY